MREREKRQGEKSNIRGEEREMKKKKKSRVKE